MAVSGLLYFNILAKSLLLLYEKELTPPYFSIIHTYTILRYINNNSTARLCAATALVLVPVYDWLPYRYWYRYMRLLPWTYDT